MRTKNGDLIAALKVFKDILATLLSKYGEEHPRIGASLHNLGIVHLRSGNLSDALDAMEEAIRIRKLTLKSRHPKVVVCEHHKSTRNSKRFVVQRSL